MSFFDEVGKKITDVGQGTIQKTKNILLQNALMLFVLTFLLFHYLINNTYSHIFQYLF